MLTQYRILLQWLTWYAVIFTANTNEYSRWRRTGSITPWYQSSPVAHSSILVNHDSNNWRPYETTNEELLHRQTALSSRNGASQLLENEELFWNIRNVLQKIGSQLDINELLPIWDSIRRGVLTEQIERFLQQQQREKKQYQSNNYGTLRRQAQRLVTFQ
uniref:Uncharacterized protein n=1 Tax=Setaria digitata TaxID=48799 RepID=A0A915PKU9_9BILA